MSCLLTSGGAFSCSALKQGGIFPTLYLYNWDDWKAATITRGVDGTISAIVNDTGLKAWDFSVADSGNLIPTCVLRAIEGGQDGFDHQIDSKLYLTTQAARENLSKLRFGKVVAIVQRITGEGLVYGEGVGLRISDWNESPGDAALGNVIQFVLKTPDNDPPETKTPVVIDTATYAGNVALIASLIVAGT